MNVNVDYTPTSARSKNGQACALAQTAPAGLMDAGARTRIVAFLDVNPNWDGVVCLPDKITHWAQISADEIVSFQSFLSGRLANLLGAEMTLSSNALSDTMSRPERLATHLRSAELSDPAATLGHLIGAELAAAKPYWLGQNIAILGTSPLCDIYVTALGEQGLPVQRG